MWSKEEIYCVEPLADLQGYWFLVSQYRKPLSDFTEMTLSDII